MQFGPLAACFAATIAAVWPAMAQDAPQPVRAPASSPAAAPKPAAPKPGKLATSVPAATTSAKPDTTPARPVEDAPADDRPLIPDPVDTRAGSLHLTGRAGIWGATSGIVGDSSVLGLGIAPGLRLGIGLNRHLVLDLDADIAFALDTCDACRLTTFSVGGGLTAHPSQGFAVDPWVRLGMAYRGVSYDASTAAGVESVSLSAFDLAKIGFGADYSPVPAVGLGFFAEGAVGVRLDSTVAYGVFQGGLTLSFSPFATSPAPPATAETTARK